MLLLSLMIVVETEETTVEDEASAFLVSSTCCTFSVGSSEALSCVAFFSETGILVALPLELDRVDLLVGVTLSAALRPLETDLDLDLEDFLDFDSDL